MQAFHPGLICISSTLKLDIYRSSDDKQQYILDRIEWDWFAEGWAVSLRLIRAEWLSGVCVVLADRNHRWIPRIEATGTRITSGQADHAVFADFENDRSTWQHIFHRQNVVCQDVRHSRKDPDVAILQFSWVASFRYRLCCRDPLRIGCQTRADGGGHGLVPQHLRRRNDQCHHCHRRLFPLLGRLSPVVFHANGSTGTGQQPTVLDSQDLVHSQRRSHSDS